MADNKVNSGLLEFSEDQKVFVALDAETSEVKKAVTIDGDGVETDIQGVQPSGKKEITTTAEVNVANYATAQVVDEDLVAGNIKKDVDILGVVGSYEAETPASDFSTVKVIFTLDSSVTEPFYINIVNLYDNKMYTGVDTEDVDPEGIDAVLYKGVGEVKVDSSYSVKVKAVTGNATIKSPLHVDITGDCSITYELDTVVN